MSLSTNPRRPHMGCPGWVLAGASGRICYANLITTELELGSRAFGCRRGGPHPLDLGLDRGRRQIGDRCPVDHGSHSRVYSNDVGFAPGEVEHSWTAGADQNRRIRPLHAGVAPRLRTLSRRAVREVPHCGRARYARAHVGSCHTTCIARYLRLLYVEATRCGETAASVVGDQHPVLVARRLVRYRAHGGLASGVGGLTGARVKPPQPGLVSR